MVVAKDPTAAIAKVAWKGQPSHLRKYKAGYEEYLVKFPEMPEGKFQAKEFLSKLGKELKSAKWIKDRFPKQGEFDRFILALAEPQLVHNNWVAGPQIIVARWGDGFQSPVHGHNSGFLYEELISGSVIVTTYRETDSKARIARIVETKLISEGIFLSEYLEDGRNDRSAFIHSFKSTTGGAVSLHFVPEYNRDGRDNGYVVEHFEDVYGLDQASLIRYDSQRVIYRSQSKQGLGDVYLVRSENVPFGDHYIVITGHPIMKEHGLRPQERTIDAPYTKNILDKYEMSNGAILLKLDKHATEAFHQFHEIRVTEEGVQFGD